MQKKLRNPTTARIRWEARGDKLLPFNPEFEDFYTSLDGDASESICVFMEANRLEERFSVGGSFCIAELGFGFGLNFLLSAALFLEKNQNKNDRLSFVSFELYPPSAADLECYLQSVDLSQLAAKDQIRQLAIELLRQYPAPLLGGHRIILADGRIQLTLFLGEAGELLREARFLADAWFLDGFAPSRNSALWSDEILSSVAAKSGLETTLSSYTAASAVRKTLEACGYQVSKLPGYGNKRERIIAEFRPDSTESGKEQPLKKTAESNQSVCVIGAGLAGVTAAHALLKRGFSVELIERQPLIAAGSSGNAAAVLQPYPLAQQSPRSRFYLLGFLHSLRALTELGGFAVETGFIQCAALRLVINKQLKNVYELLPAPAIPQAMVAAVRSDEHPLLRELHIAEDALHFPTAGVIAPKTLCNSLVEHFHRHYPERFRLQLETEAIQIERTNGYWSVSRADGTRMYQGDQVVLANASDSRAFAQSSHLPLRPLRGEIVELRETCGSRRLAAVLCADTYITPALNGVHVAGATYDHRMTSLEPTVEKQIDIIEKLSKWSPHLRFAEEDILGGRAGFRATTPDRMPMIGRISEEHNGLYISSGHGSRGTSSCFIAAEIIASEIVGEPAPLELDLIEAISAQRFGR